MSDRIQAKLRLNAAIKELEASRAKAEVPAYPDVENDGDSLELSEKEAKYLKR